MPRVDLPAPPQPARPLPAEPDRRPQPARRVVLLLALFCAGLFGTARLAALRLPFPEVETVKAKVDWLARHGEEYDTLFVGSSRTFRHIIPRLFDQLMAEAGMPTHSFNLGINAMRPPEDTYLLETVLAKRRAPLKLVVMETNSIDVCTSDDKNQGSARVVYWHDFKRFQALLRCILEEGPPNNHYRGALKSGLWQWEAARYNLTLYLAKTLHAGRGFELWDVLAPGKAPPPAVNRTSYDGYDFYGTPLAHIDQKEWELLQQRMAMFASHSTRVKERKLSSQLELREQRRLVASLGGTVISYIGPLPAGAEYLPDPALHPGLPVFNFANPELYPALFQRENRQDVGHLNQKGAEVFTRMLVEKIVATQKRPESK